MRRIAGWTWAGLWGLVIMATVAGCGPQLGALAYYVTPEKKNKADYKMPPTRLAILIDDPYGSLPRADLRTRIHSSLVTELTVNKVPASVVPLSEIARLEQEHRDFDKLSIRAVGEQVHADHVLHVLILSFSTGEEASHGVYSGKARAQVKVCSTEPKPAVRIWPPSGDGYIVEVQQPSEQAEEWGNTGAADRYAQAIADRLAARIAMLFYDHSAESETDLVTGRNRNASQ
jgi:hypothetical protein